MTTVSKKQVAGAIYEKMTAAGTQRKFIIEAMMKEANLSFSGASTYYQNFKSGQWDPVSKTPEAKPDPKIGVDFGPMSDDELLMFFNTHSKVTLTGFVCRDDALAAINKLC